MSSKRAIRRRTMRRDQRWRGVVNRLRYRAIQILDWLDHHLLRHRFYNAVCCRLAVHPWRDVLCGQGCKPGDDGFCVWCGWGMEAPRG